LGAPREEIDRLHIAADRIDPLNYSPRVEYMHALAPKWGRAEEGEQERYRKELLASDLPADIKNDLDYRALRFQANDYVMITPAKAEWMGRGIKLYDDADRICSAYSENADIVVSFYAKTGQHQAGMDYLGRYVVKNPKDGWGFVQRGAILYRLGRIEDSLADYKRAHELGNPRGTYGFGWFYEEGKAVPKDLRRALDLYEQAARQDLPDGRTGSERVRKLLNQPKEPS
jgi:TPR repeat protein